MHRFYALFRCDQKHLAAAQLENITNSLTQMLEGYDIRLRPNFGGKFHYFDLNSRRAFGLPFKSTGFYEILKSTEMFNGSIGNVFF